MNRNLTPQIPVVHTARRVEGEGVLRILLIALALAMPLASMAYLKMQNMRISYEMSHVRDMIKQQEELSRTLSLERSKYQRDEEIQSFAKDNGMQPRKQSYLVPRHFTREDQRLAKLVPGASARK